MKGPHQLAKPRFQCDTLDMGHIYSLRIIVDVVNGWSGHSTLPAPHNAPCLLLASTWVSVLQRRTETSGSIGRNPCLVQPLLGKRSFKHRMSIQLWGSLLDDTRLTAERSQQSPCLRTVADHRLSRPLDLHRTLHSRPGKQLSPTDCRPFAKPTGTGLLLGAEVSSRGRQISVLETRGREPVAA